MNKAQIKKVLKLMSIEKKNLYKTPVLKVFENGDGYYSFDKLSVLVKNTGLDSGYYAKNDLDIAVKTSSEPSSFIVCNKDLALYDHNKNYNKMTNNDINNQFITNMIKVEKSLKSAIGKDKTRNFMCGLFFDFKQGNIVATDGRRLHKKPCLDGFNFDFLMPDYVANLIPESIYNISYTKNGCLLFSDNDGMFFAVEKIDGQFPVYQRVIPEFRTLKKTLEIKYIELYKKTLIAKNEKTFKILFENKNGENVDLLAFDYRYLSDISEKDDIKLFFNDTEGACMVKKGVIVYVIMPMKAG